MKVNETENSKTTGKTNGTKSWYLEEINKTDKPLAWLRKEKTHITNVRNERLTISSDTVDIKRKIKEYYEQLYTHKFDDLHEKDLVLERHSLPKLTQGEIENLNRYKTTKPIE